MRRFADVAGRSTWRMLKKYATTPSPALPVARRSRCSSSSRSPAACRRSRACRASTSPRATRRSSSSSCSCSRAAFGGVFTGFGIAADFENGFSRRLMLAAPNRLAILAGYVAGGARARAADRGAAVRRRRSSAGCRSTAARSASWGSSGLGVGVALAAALFSAGVAMRLRTIQAGPAMQMPVFILLFLAPVYVPLALLTGWVKAVAHVNPVTPLLETGRDFISGSHPDLLLAAGVALGLVVVFARVGRARTAQRRGGRLRRPWNENRARGFVPEAPRSSRLKASLPGRRPCRPAPRSSARRSRSLNGVVLFCNLTRRSRRAAARVDAWHGHPAERSRTRGWKSLHAEVLRGLALVALRRVRGGPGGGPRDACGDPAAAPRGGAQARPFRPAARRSAAPH